MVKSSAAILKEHREASKTVMKKALRSKRAARAFLIGAGILDKNGKKLAKPYRS
jgi:hypothetical protein